MIYNIEVCTSKSCSTTEKGNLLETLTAEILKSQQYTVVTTVRLTGMEVDVLAKHNYTGEQIFVECKAWSDSLPADVITKLLGNVFLKNVTAGWLVTTGPLGKDAEGIRNEWENKLPEERHKLTFYTSERIIDLLISNHIVINPNLALANIPSDYSVENSNTLLITNVGRFWIFPVSNVIGGIATSIFAFDASSGKMISDKKILFNLKQMKSVYFDYDWITTESGVDNVKSSQLENEYQNIVTVMSGDDWKDYRPSRPNDFVGRINLLKDIFAFFNSVRQKQTETRLFAIKSPSGWGKSSTILKIVDMAKSRRKSKDYFVYAVDVRTAMSARYAELAFKSCIENAIDSQFISCKKNELSFGNVNNIFETDSMKKFIAQLKSQNKVIVLIFDQFEEIFSKRELFGLFDNIRNLSNTIDSSKENIILGFAWKTDLTIPVDHPAYFLWSDLCERRKEFDLTQFKESEIKSSINVFSMQLNQKINPILCRYLTRQCQGYPWLLKKLCIHVYNLINEGTDQDTVIGQTLNISDLFEKDINNLTAEENACIIDIAKESPADYFKIVEAYGLTSLQSLINKRIVIRRTSKLILYWDIFRDYVLNRTIPTVIVDYIPQMQFSTVAKVIILIENGNTEIQELADKTSLGINTIDNIMIDLTMFGLVNREKKTVKLLYSTNQDILGCMRAFFERHIIFVALKKENKGNFSYEAFSELFYHFYPNEAINEKTKNAYCSKLFNWLSNLNLIIEDNHLYQINQNPSALIDLSGANYHTNRKSRRLASYVLQNKELGYCYWPQNTPQKLISCFEFISGGDKVKLDLVKNNYKKGLEDLLTLKTISYNYEGRISRILSIDQLLERVKSFSNIEFAIQSYIESPTLKNQDFGKLIADQFDKHWSPDTQRTTGRYLKKWAEYFSSVDNQDTSY